MTRTNLFSGSEGRNAHARGGTAASRAGASSARAKSPTAALLLTSLFLLLSLSTTTPIARADQVPPGSGTYYHLGDNLFANGTNALNTTNYPTVDGNLSSSTTIFSDSGNGGSFSGSCISTVGANVTFNVGSQPVDAISYKLGWTYSTVGGGFGTCVMAGFTYADGSTITVYGPTSVPFGQTTAIQGWVNHTGLVGVTNVWMRTGISGCNCAGITKTAQVYDIAGYNKNSTTSDPILNMGILLAANTTLGTARSPLDVQAGASLSLTCTEIAEGTTPPGAPDANGIILRGYADGQGFPNGGTGVIWTRTYSSCLTPQTFSVSCTVDGTAAGAPYFGTVRLYVRAVRTSAIAYDDNSDQGSGTAGANQDLGNIGAYRCNPIETTSLALTPAQSVYAGGQIVTLALNTNAKSHTSTNVGTLTITCGAGGASTTYAQGSTTHVTLTSTIAQPAWSDKCVLSPWRASMTQNSAITGWTSTAYATWDAASADAISNSGRDVTVTSARIVSYGATFDGVNLTSCSAGVPTCANQSAFVISLDQLFAQPYGLRDSAGAIATGVGVSCTQYHPDGTADATDANQAMGSTDATGTVPSHQFGVQVPAASGWAMNCTASWSGNYATYNETLSHASSITSDITCPLSWSQTSTVTLQFNVTILCRYFDHTTGQLTPIAPTAPPRLSVLAWNATRSDYTDIVLNRSIMTRLSATETGYYLPVQLNASNVSTNVFAIATLNFSGRPPFAISAPWNATPAFPTSVENFTVQNLTVAKNATAKSVWVQTAVTTTTALDAYVQPAVFGGMTVAATVTSLWVGRKPGILGKLAIATLLIVAVIWAASASVSSDANAFRWIAVVITSGWVLIVLLSMRERG